ncbi:MAG TPA: flagellar hook-length control protein FliK [Rubrivivax sp.]|nr:flagellar hook-length control protein FliK [Rubrivivax sp.]
MNSLALPVAPSAPKPGHAMAKPDAAQTDEPGAFARELQSARDGAAPEAAEHRARSGSPPREPIRKSNPRQGDDKPGGSANEPAPDARQRLLHLVTPGLRESTDEDSSGATGIGPRASGEQEAAQTGAAGAAAGGWPADMLLPWQRQPPSGETSGVEPISQEADSDGFAGIAPGSALPTRAVATGNMPADRGTNDDRTAGAAAGMSAPWSGIGAGTDAAAGRSGEPLRAETAGARPAAGAPAGEPTQPSFAAELARAGVSPGIGAAGMREHAQINLPTPVHSPEFVPRLAAEVALLVRNGVQEARVHVHPQELGPIAVHIALDGNAAQVRLAVDSALTRELLEQGMPTLAGALRDSGLTLAGGDVFQQPRDPAPGQGQDGSGRRPHTPQRGDPAVGGGEDARTPGAGAGAPRAMRALGGVDIFA